MGGALLILMVVLVVVAFSVGFGIGWFFKGDQIKKKISSKKVDPSYN